MLADPQSVTISATPYSLARTSSGVNLGEFSEAAGSVRERVQHTYGGRTRRLVRLDHRKIAADPLISAQSIEYSMGVYVVFDLPRTGYTVSEAKAIWDGFSAQLAASSGAMITKVLGGES
jgi:hypothetical protein